MKDSVLLILSGCFVAVLAWATWHWWSEYFTLAVLVIVLLEYTVDNFQLQRQVRGLLAARDRRERNDALRRVVASLVALREKKGRG
jgi:cell division protein FtsW (lipid II flippase)